MRTENRITSNKSKTIQDFIIFRNSRKLLHGDDSVDILINGIKIERVRYVKFLGVYIDVYLRWDDQLIIFNKSPVKLLKM